MMPAEQSHIMKRMLEGMSLDTKVSLFALNCLPSTVCPQLFALNCLPSTVCPETNGGRDVDTKALVIYELVEDNRAIIKPNEMMVRR